jgi:collagenase-like protein with putative collagen-binding domain
VMREGQRMFSVAMSALDGRARARWFDPTSGNYIAISDGYEYANTGTRTFTTPGEHGDGTDDWVLVIDSTGTPTCGSITKTGVYTAPSTLLRGVTCGVTASLRSDPSVVERIGVTIMSS